ncbi:MAG TPA: hypothetical protein H9743_04525 [Candidatus Mediterraneibacter vanvlietii]|nr:hypothetical protein [Candidatus Mediterraneibacter vanvlietii]
MKKKVLTLLLAAVMGASVCACGSSEKSGGSISVVQTEPLESSEEDAEGGAEADQDTEEDTAPDYDVEEQVLLDSEGIKITATGLSINEFHGYLELNLSVENQTDTDIGIGTCSAQIDIPAGVGNYVYLNGYQVDSSILIDVPAHSTADDTCTFYWDDLKEAGIEEIGEIELAFNIHDSDYNDILTGEQTKCTIRTTLEEEPDTELSDDMPLLLDAGGWQIYGKYVPADEEMPEDKGHILAVCRNVSGSSAQLHFSEIAVDGTVLTYEASIGGTLNIGDHYYENPEHAVICSEYFSAADNVPEISDSSVITAVLEASGSETGDYSNVQTLGTVTFPIAE